MEPSTPPPFSFLQVGSAPVDGAADEHLDALVASISAAVPSLWGIDMVVVRAGHPLVLSLYRVPRPAPAVGEVRTSLRLPLPLLAPGFEAGSDLVVYAGVAGALVDLAADAAYVLGRDGIVLDADLTPPDHAPAVLGLDELIVVERALGVLIEQGHAPEEVDDVLRARAAAAGLEPYVFALEVLATAHPDGPDKSG